MIEKYSYYEFEVFQDFNETWIYKIYSEGCPPYDDGVIDSDEYYDSEKEARFAAIGHIGLLENGEG
jgi:hypothetical protein